MKSLLTAFLAISIAITVSGCASWGSLSITSDPPGAVAHMRPSGLTDQNSRKFHQVGITPVQTWSFDKFNWFGAAWAWVEWPDGIRSDVKGGVVNKIHFVKSEYANRPPQPTPLAAPIQSLALLPPGSWTIENAAIADLTAHALSDVAAITLTEQLQSTLVDTKYFNIISRSDMKAVLDAQQFSRSDACDDSACLVEMGRILAVQKIIGGSIGLVGSTYTISIRLVDVETGKTEVATTQKLKAAPDELLDLIQVAGIELAAKYAETKK